MRLLRSIVVGVLFILTTFLSCSLSAQTTGVLRAIEARDWAKGTYVWKVYASNSGVSAGSTTAGSGALGSTTLVETGKWVKE